MLLAIDPGLNSTGWALFGPRDPRVLSQVPIAAGLVTGKRKNEDVVTRARLSAAELFTKVSQIVARGAFGSPPLRVISEFPDYQATASRTMGWKTGDLQKLALLVGIYAAVFTPLPFKLVVPREWKGQLPKDVVIRRITERLGHHECERLQLRMDAWDAVGIGLWQLDELQQGKKFM